MIPGPGWLHWLVIALFVGVIAVSVWMAVFSKEDG